MAEAGSDQVEAFAVNTANLPNFLTPAVGIGQTVGGVTGVFPTQGHIPYGLALDEQLGAQGTLIVADWGGEEVELIDVATGNQVGIPQGANVAGPQQLEFFQPPYPATNVERGEFNFVNETWSNNGRKSCAGCHMDWQFGTDSLPFDNGAAAPVTAHRVKMNANIADTAAYFWNGSFADNNYASVAFDAQTKDNCRIIEFGIVEGLGSVNRIGDPKNVSANTNNDDAVCNPVEVQPTIVNGFVANEANIVAASLNEQNTVIFPHIQQVTGVNVVQQQGLASAQLNAFQAKEEVNREIDIYSLSNLRLPPNPQNFLYNSPVSPTGTACGNTYTQGCSQLASSDWQSVKNGEALFQSAGCVACHNPTNVDQLGYKTYVDNQDHGPGADWLSRFVKQYGQTSNDQRFNNGQNVAVFTVPGSNPAFVINGLADIPSVTTDVLQFGFTVEPTTINTIYNKIDFFIPFCFDTQNCLEFDDPLLVVSGDNPQNANFQEENRRLALIIQFNLGNTDRQWNPGYLVGGNSEISANTASLRGVWSQANYLHHGYARSIREAILAPGHPALLPGELGYAQDVSGKNDVHGTTSTLSKQQVQDLINFVQTIQ
jgi:cytochrome c peroxidase